MVNSSAAYIFSWSSESDQLAISFIPKEAREHGFEDVWTNAVKRMNCIVPSGLTKEHMVALYAYTADYPKHDPFYRRFNEAVRQYGTNEIIYDKRFVYKSYHYLLATALEKLTTHSPAEFEWVYRGIRKLAKGIEGSRMRFGSYTSSSLDEGVALDFIDNNTKWNTMFFISSRYGVQIEKYSCFSEEKEVLIPPYEVFQVGRITSRKYGNYVPLTGVDKQGIQVKLEIGDNGKLVVVPNEGTANSALGGLWILIAAACIVM
ncbi:GPI-linked NAD(P)(+)--arginine ADP-ribosyltransferase 1-like [Chiloscyllium punctatum]